MSQITLNLTAHNSTSLQQGDIVYYLGTDSNKKRIGPLTSKTPTTITCDTDTNSDLTQLTASSYLFFGKDNIVNSSGIIGYYAEVNLSNNSQQEAELFAVNSEIFISSN
jgi:hypothetical protein